MAYVEFPDKDNSLPTSDSRRLVRDVDLNELKDVINENYDAAVAAFAARPATDAFVVGEVPGGTLNGINTVFTLAHQPVIGTIAIYDGLRLKNGTDYTISGGTNQTITFTVAPDVTANLQADYIAIL